MTTALFGHTGFVGSNLRRAFDFDRLYNSANAHESAGQHFTLTVFSAARAEKWRANQDPALDEAHIAELGALLNSFTTDQLVLVSTVDVFRSPIAVDETTPIDTTELHPYGANRYWLEQIARQAQPNTLVVRLPALFGPGLKKNVIYDLLHDNNVDRIHRAGEFQYYNLAHLWKDLHVALDHHLELIHLASEPVRTDELARVVFGIEFDNEPADVFPGRYDMRTVHASAFGAEGSYQYDKDAMLSELASFAATEGRG